MAEHSHNTNVLSVLNNGFMRKFYVSIYLSVGKGDILATEIRKRPRNLERHQPRE